MTKQRIWENQDQPHIRQWLSDDELVDPPMSDIIHEYVYREPSRWSVLSANCLPRFRPFVYWKRA